MTNREPLLRLLDRYRAYNAHEERMRARMRDFVAAHEDCFERSLAIGHVTGSAWVVDLEREYVLLTHHHKLGKWLQLGGHADGNPDILKVALREVREESGLEDITPVSESVFDVDIHEIPARKDEPAHYHHDARFLVEADRKTPLNISAESKALQWVRLSEVHLLTTEESILRMVRKTPSGT